MKLFIFITEDFLYIMYCSHIWIYSTNLFIYLCLCQFIYEISVHIFTGAVKLSDLQCFSNFWTPKKCRIQCKILTKRFYHKQMLQLSKPKCIHWRSLTDCSCSNSLILDLTVCYVCLSKTWGLLRSTRLRAPLLYCQDSSKIWKWILPTDNWSPRG